MAFLKKYKTILIVLVVLVAGFYVYSQFFAGGDDGGLLVREEGPAAVAGGDDLLILLRGLQNINLSGDIFQDNTFRSLQDFSVDLVPVTPGRENPFAPF